MAIKFTKLPLCKIPKCHVISLHLLSKACHYYTKIGIFGMKIYHPATLRGRRRLDNDKTPRARKDQFALIC
jgi:hypothetical protein